jgi:hypothetical protein
MGPLASKKKDRNLRLYPIFEGPLLWRWFNSISEKRETTKKMLNHLKDSHVNPMLRKTSTKPTAITRSATMWWLTLLLCEAILYKKILLLLTGISMDFVFRAWTIWHSKGLAYRCGVVRGWSGVVRRRRGFQKYLVTLHNPFSTSITQSWLLLVEGK